eukprot:4224588-Amphidinium_carterae.1
MSNKRLGEMKIPHTAWVKRLLDRSEFTWQQRKKIDVQHHTPLQRSNALHLAVQSCCNPGCAGLKLSTAYLYPAAASSWAERVSLAW